MRNIPAAPAMSHSELIGISSRPITGIDGHIRTWSIGINLLSEFEMHIQERQQCKERPFWFLSCTITWLLLFHFSQFPSVTVS